MKLKVEPTMIVCNGRDLTLSERGAGAELVIPRHDSEYIDRVTIGEAEAKSIACWLAKRYGFSVATSARVVRMDEYTAVPEAVPVAAEAIER